MAKTLVLTNLKTGVTEELIRNFLFDQGEIRSITLIQAQDSQQAFAYVTMNSDDEAAVALRELNHSDFLGQDVSISRAG